MKKAIGLITILALVLLINGCAKEGSSESLGIRGEIKEVYLSEDGTTISGILVEGELQEDTMYDYASVTIDENTSVYRGEEEAAAEELEEGLQVEIVFEGPVAESYPVQGLAKEIKILED